MMSMLASNRNETGHDLAEVSLEAAIQFDRILRGRSADNKPIDKLKEALDRIVAAANSNENILKVDLPTVSAFDTALRANMDRPISGARDLYSIINDVLSGINEEHRSSGYKQSQFLRDFCTSLHRALISQELDFAEEDTLAPRFDKK